MSTCFIWVIVQHPLVVKRFEELRKKEDAVQPWPIGSQALSARSADISSWGQGLAATGSTVWIK